MTVDYHFENGPFGEMLIAATSKGVCRLSFVDEREMALYDLKRQFQGEELRDNYNGVLKGAVKALTDENGLFVKVKLDVDGTPFQIRVWKALRDIPVGQTTTYKHVAEALGCPKSSRAVGNAVAKNPIAILIPCHRVIRSDGKIGDYHWGSGLKKALLEREYWMALDDAADQVERIDNFHGMRTVPRKTVSESRNVSR